MDEHKTEVVIPSYTCYSVPSSIANAGLTARILDIDPTTLDYDYDKLENIDFENVLAIISSNLYGLPNNLPNLENLVAKYNVYLIDDAAQAMGATIGHRFCGTFGEVGIFSLDKGKNITSIDGGIIITNSDELARLVQKEVVLLQEPSSSNMLIYILKILIYSLFMHPNLYWLPNNLPFLKLGATKYTTDYPLAAYSKILAGIGVQLFKRLDEITNIRVANALRIKSDIASSRKISLISAPLDSKPVFLRLPVLVNDPSMRNLIIKKLQKKGIGATGSYPASIAEIDEVRNITNLQLSEANEGMKIARKIITLPTHPYLQISDIQKISSVLR
jgi:dTDP-4-amino-4,6-dideoxygalactose transaminase